jgi:branched-chain amino acid transport system substrate-binding protein
MEKNTTTIALILVAVIVGGGIGYFLAPRGDGGQNGDGTTTIEVLPLEGQTIQLGYISSTTVGLETATPLVQDIIVPDINNFAEQLGYDVQFDYLIDDATSQAAVHLEKVQGFKSVDVNVFIGGGWSSQAQAALSYVNDNNMLMWSASSTSPLLAIANDNLYRMCPTDLIQAPAIARMLESYGIEAVVLIYRGDAWADGIVNYFEPEFANNGGVILEKIRYAGESTEFSNYLQTAENIVQQAVQEYGTDKVGVEIISFAEFVTMITQAQDYETLYGLPWFGSDGTVLSQQAIDDAPQQANHLKIYSTYAAPAESAKFNDLYERYFGLVGQPFGYYSATTYDIAWVLTTSILESQSIDALDVIPLQYPVSFNQWGASGWNRLNADGDRYGSNYQIWGYGDLGQGVQNVVYGLYDSTINTVSWNTDVLGFTPQGR